MRDVKGKHTRVHLLSAFLRAKSRVLTNESEVSSHGNRRTGAYVRVVVLGVLGVLYCLLGRKLGSFAGASALQASGRHRTTLVRDAH